MNKSEIFSVDINQLTELNLFLNSTNFKVKQIYIVNIFFLDLFRDFFYYWYIVHLVVYYLSRRWALLNNCHRAERSYEEKYSMTPQ